MTTNLDIKAFLETSQAAHDKERKDDRELRARERQEDMEYILSMIQTGVQKELRAAIQPVEERLKIQEKVNQDLAKQFVSAMKEIDELKRAVDNQKNFPGLPVSHLRVQSPQNVEKVQDISSRARGRGYWSRGEMDKRPYEEDELSISKQEMCSSARKVIGFTPIEPRMLDLQVQSYGAKDMEEAKLMEIKNYLKCELKMRPSEIEDLDIVKIFPQAREDWNVLYVEFGSSYEVDKVFSHTRYMTKQNRRVLR